MRLLLYLSPALMDWMVFFVSFAVFYAAGARGAGIQECGLLGILFQSVYMAGSFTVGHFVTHLNARRFLLSGILVSGISGGCCIYFRSTVPLAISLAVFAISAALFFNSFQAFMRGGASAGSLKKSVALYTFSWCSGAALGNVTAGFLYNWGLLAMISTVALATIFLIAMLIAIREGAGECSHDEKSEHGTSPANPVDDCYVWVGWIMMFTVTFVQRPLFTFLPPLFAAEGISSLMASLPLFVHMASIAIFGFIMFWFRDLLYRRLPLCIIQSCGALALCMIWIWPSYWVCFCMLFILGIYGAFTFYCAVYYSSNSGRRSFNIGINEALVGSGSVAGLFFGDWWMRLSGSDNEIYMVCATGIAVSIFAQVAFVGLKRKKTYIQEAT